jgi:hypothetical protein
MKERSFYDGRRQILTYNVKVLVEEGDLRADVATALGLQRSIFFSGELLKFDEKEGQLYISAFDVSA